MYLGDENSGARTFNNLVENLFRLLGMRRSSAGGQTTELGRHGDWVRGQVGQNGGVPPYLVTSINTKRMTSGHGLRSGAAILVFQDRATGAIYSLVRG
jgi:hypothetical protein